MTEAPCTQCGSRKGSFTQPCREACCELLVCLDCHRVFGHVGRADCSCCDSIFGEVP